LQWHIPPTLLAMACVSGHLGDYGGAVNDLRESLRSMERLKLPRYQLMAHEMLASMLLDVGLSERAHEESERGLTLAEAAGITFWRARREGTHAIARMRLGDLDVGPALHQTLRWARENDERSQMVRCLEGLAELALRRGELDACGKLADEMLALAEGAAMKELAARARLWRGQALAALGNRDSAVDELGRASAAAEEIGRVRVALDACEALAKVSGDASHRARASALAERIAASARDCESLMEKI
jgi:hypothetical protein